MPYAVGVIETGQYAFLIQISVGSRGFALIPMEVAAGVSPRVPALGIHLAALGARRLPREADQQVTILDATLVWGCATRCLGDLRWSFGGEYSGSLVKDGLQSSVDIMHGADLHQPQV